MGKTIHNAKFGASKRMSELEIRTNAYRKSKILTNKPFNQKQFCDDVIFWRSYLVQTVRQSAEESGVAISVFSRVEKGNAPNMENFVKLCNWMYKLTGDYFK